MNKSVFDKKRKKIYKLFRVNQKSNNSAEAQNIDF